MLLLPTQAPVGFAPNLEAHESDTACFPLALDGPFTSNKTLMTDTFVSIICGTPLSPQEQMLAVDALLSTTMDVLTRFADSVHALKVVNGWLEHAITEVKPTDRISTLDLGSTLTLKILRLLGRLPMKFEALRLSGVQGTVEQMRTSEAGALIQKWEGTLTKWNPAANASTRLGMQRPSEVSRTPKRQKAFERPPRRTADLDLNGEESEDESIMELAS